MNLHRESRMRKRRVHWKNQVFLFQQFCNLFWVVAFPSPQLKRVFGKEMKTFLETQTIEKLFKTQIEMLKYFVHL